MGFIERDTRSGRLRGLRNGGVISFLGVRYGENTSGAHRFRAPRPALPWGGMRDATTFGPVAPQVDAGGEGVAGALKWLEHPRGGTALEGAGMSEDCLRLNIWAPSEASEPLPVLVWLHGGGFTNGSGNELWFNGDILAAQEDIVVVTVTHRLGALGFLDLREESVGGIAESANVGMLDIVEALRWVQANIAQFGGDPSRVTIAGHSGGAGKVATLLAMPAADHLYRRAIMQSGPVRKLSTAEQTRPLRDHVLQATGIRSLSELEALPLDQLLDAQNAALQSLDGSALLDMDTIPGFAPSIDPVDVPTHPFEEALDRSGRELLTGWTTHEMGSLLAGNPIYTTAMDEATAIAVLDHLMRGHGAEAFAAATIEGPTDPPHLRFARAMSQAAFRDETLAVADAFTRSGGSVWVYNFDQPTEVLGGLLGACHGLDIPYVFGTIDRSPITGRAPGRELLSQEMMHAWASFARDGAPSVPGEWDNWNSEKSTAHRFAIPADH